MFISLHSRANYKKNVIRKRTNVYLYCYDSVYIDGKEALRQSISVADGDGVKTSWQISQTSQRKLH